ncbi:alpha/beta hydrolase [Egicoccus halophilus]|uniref:Hydrolase n=1 Tax=Egicoccus halophilus TaxID=1670830 RepID=A0A8J3EXS3_9ACTN|nr:alpha/beta hydrolase [Egicoccus halophilus]GGI06344.1 hydrolase [Egicoccus halophilus]
MPSLRARLVRQGLATSVRLMRARGSGAPDPDGPLEQLEAYALRMREQMEELGDRLPLPRTASWEACDLPGVLGEWVRDEAAGDTDRVVLHVHGGAYAMGSPRSHRGLGASLSRTARAPVLLPEYRLAPEHVYPAAFEDVLSAWNWLTGEYGAEPGRVAVSGDSAGGGLGLSLLVHLRDQGRPLPGCYVGMSPWTDLAGTGGSMQELDEIDPWLTAGLVAPAARAYAGELELDDPRISPHYADLTGLPPMLVHVGGHEILRDDARRLVARARQAGVDASLGEFPGLWHVFHAFPGFPESRRALREIGAFMRRHTGDDVVLAHRRSA